MVWSFDSFAACLGRARHPPNNNHTVHIQRAFDRSKKATAIK